MNILVLAEGQLGDLLLLTPALRALRNGHPGARVTVLIFQRHSAAASASREVVHPADGRGTAAVMTLHPCVDEVLEVDRPRLRALRGMARLRGEWSVVKAIRARSFDRVLCTFPEDRFAVLAFLSGAGVRVGQKQQSLSWLLTTRPSIDKTSMGVRDYYCALAEHAGGRVESTATEFCVPPSADAIAHQRLLDAGVRGDRWVAVHPGASGDYKIWPPERFAELLDGLRQHDLQPVLLAGGADGPIVESIVRRCSNAVPVIATGNDVALLAALLRRAALCVTNDSGPRHLAIAVGARSLALFRQFHGTEWKIYPDTPSCVTMTGSQPCSACPPLVCLDRTPPGEQYGSHCLRQLTSHDVLARALQMLAA